MGPLSVKILSSKITMVNAQVALAIERPADAGSGGPYLHLTPKQKYSIGKRPRADKHISPLQLSFS